MGRTKDEYRRRIAFLKRLRVILLAVAVVLAVCAAGAAWMGRTPDDTKTTFPTIPQTTPQTTQPQSAPITTTPSLPIETTGPEDNNPFPSIEDPAGTTIPSQEEPSTEPAPTTELLPPEETNGILSQGNDLFTQNTDSSSVGLVQKPVTENKQPADTDAPKSGGNMVLKLLLLLLAADLAAIVALSVFIHLLEKESKALNKSTHQETVSRMSDALAQPDGALRVGTLHNIGARPYQEDSLGTSTLADGVLAVVADGIGGLSGGDKVSQLIVRTMLQQASGLRRGQFDGVLVQMLGKVNQEVNRMLGPDGIYKSGSTLLAVLLRRDRFHWLTVGDSRIYLYHDGHLTQLNQEHNRGQEQILRAVSGEISFQEARAASKKASVTSFLGMGKLKYVDRSVCSIPLAPGDRVLLMSDGVFNTLTDKGIASVLAGCPDPQAAANELERLVIQYGSSRQDNFSAVILGLEDPPSQGGKR